jgi:hypothetical protein
MCIIPLFILSMDVLSRLFQYHVQMDQISGVLLGRGAAPLTNIMFADDLIIMGMAQPLEAQRIIALVNIFCRISSQNLGPEKSKLWFSKATEATKVTYIQTLFQAPICEAQ